MERRWIFLLGSKKRHRHPTILRKCRNICMKTMSQSCDSFSWVTDKGPIRWAEPPGPRQQGRERPSPGKVLLSCDGSIETEDRNTADSQASTELLAELSFPITHSSDTAESNFSPQHPNLILQK